MVRPHILTERNTFFSVREKESQLHIAVNYFFDVMKIIWFSVWIVIIKIVFENPN